VSLSFFFAGIACALAALCYAEFASTVAVGWSTYFADVMKQAGMVIPAFAYGDGHNLVAALIVLILTCVICLGIRVSSQVNLVMVTIKIAVVLFVIVAGPFYIKTSNYSPFIPPTGSTPAEGAESVPSLLQDLGFAPGSSASAASSPEQPWCLRVHRIRHRRHRRRGIPISRQTRLRDDDLDRRADRAHHCDDDPNAGGSRSART